MNNKISAAQLLKVKTNVRAGRGQREDDRK